MKIVNDIEIFEPSECYFTIDSDPEDSSVVVVYITSIDYWDENNYLDDNCGGHSFDENVIPDDIFNEMEATWCSEMPANEVRGIMTGLGFVENNNLLS